MTRATVTLHPGDCLEVLAGFPDDHFDAVVTDPPYHLLSIVKRFGGANAAPAKEGTDGNFARSSRGFMGKEWDGGDIAFRADTWSRVFRVLKPGGHLVAFNHSRTFHRMAVAIEDAGFEVRDSLLDLYTSGPSWASFLESLAPDQIKGLQRALAMSDHSLLAWIYGTGFPKSHDAAKALEKIGADPSEIAAWEGWGSALKPAFEPIVLVRKPMAESSIARQVRATGTGALHIDAARIPHGDDIKMGDGISSGKEGWDRPWKHDPAAREERAARSTVTQEKANSLGRWPANVVHDGSRDVLARFPVERPGGPSAARLFYSAKANDQDRRGSAHPTVKPQELMQWLVRLVCPVGGRVLDPFGGSGSTGWAAAAEGVNCDLIERESEYQADILRGIAGLEAATAPPSALAPDALPGQLALF